MARLIIDMEVGKGERHGVRACITLLGTLAGARGAVSISKQEDKADWREPRRDWRESI